MIEHKICQICVSETKWIDDCCHQITDFLFFQFAQKVDSDVSLQQFLIPLKLVCAEKNNN